MPEGKTRRADCSRSWVGFSLLAKTEGVILLFSLALAIYLSLSPKIAHYWMSGGAGLLFIDRS